MFRVFGYKIRSISYSRNPSKVTANSVLVKRNSHDSEIFSSRKEWKERIENLAESVSDSEADVFLTIRASSVKNHESESVLIPEYGMNRTASDGLDSLWSQIQISEYDRLVLDVGTGLSWLSANSYFGNAIPIYGVSIGLSKTKMFSWLEEKRKTFGFKNYATEEAKILEAPIPSGFGSENPQILEYSKSFYNKYGIPLEPIYSGNSLYAIERKIDSGEWKGRTLYLHQGGLLNFLDQFRTH